MSILLSIKPKYVKEIEKGNKIYEFRKNIFKQEIQEIWVYASAPVKRIVGKIYIDKIIEDNPRGLWKKCKKYAGIDEEDFFQYFNGKNKGYAIKIKKYKEFSKPINPYATNAKFVAPQSYAYVENIFPELV